MSRSSDMITQPTWPSIHISFCLTIHPTPHSLLTCSPSTLSSSLHLYTVCHISFPQPTAFTTLISCYSSPPLSSPFFHLFLRSKKLLKPPALEFWSATLWPKKARQTAFPINQYLHWVRLTPVTSALHEGKCSVLEQNCKHLTYPGHRPNRTYWKTS